MTRVGVFGGSFDPVHFGHLILADSAREQLQLDRVLLVPAATSPLKGRGPLASNAARLEMLRLAIGETPGFEINDSELRRGGVSYTVDTLTEIAREHPQAKLFLIVGSDQIGQLARWRQPEKISALATWAFVHRAGFPPVNFEMLIPYATPQQVDDARSSVLEMPAFELSSTELRQRASERRSLRFRTPALVEDYIRSNRIYSADRR